LKKLAVLILIVCLVRLPVFAGDYDEETSTAAALLASGETWLIVLGGVLVVAILVAVGVTAMAKADEPSDGLYLVSDNNQIIKQVQKKALYSTITPIVDYRFSETNGSKTFIGIRFNF